MLARSAVFYEHKLSAVSEFTIIINGVYDFIRVMTLSSASDNGDV